MISVRIKAMPIKQSARLQKIDKVLDYIPAAFDNEGNLINEYFLKKVIKRENMNKYRISYEILSKKYLSGLCYSV